MDLKHLDHGFILQNRQKINKTESLGPILEY